MSNIRKLFPDGPPYDGYTCACGETWFDLAVVLDKGKRVTGWHVDATCTRCGEPATIQGWSTKDD